MLERLSSVKPITISLSLPGATSRMPSAGAPGGRPRELPRLSGFVRRFGHVTAEQDLEAEERKARDPQAALRERRRWRDRDRDAGSVSCLVLCSFGANLMVSFVMQEPDMVHSKVGAEGMFLARAGPCQGPDGAQEHCQASRRR